MEQLKQADEINRTWDWIDDGLLPYALAAMRTVWLWLALQLFAPLLTPGRELLSPLLVFGLLAGSTLLMQTASIRLRGRLGKALVVVGGVVAVFLTLYAALGNAFASSTTNVILITAFGAWCWWWGMMAGQDRLTYDTYARNFMYGVIALALIVVLALTTHLIPVTGLVLPVLLFFAVGLGTLAMASLRDAQRYESAAAGESFALNRYWLGTVGIFVGILMVVGLLVGGLFAPEWAQGAMGVLNFLWQIVSSVLLAIAYVIVTILVFVFRWLRQFIHLPSETQPPPPLEPLPSSNDFLRDPQGAAATLPPEVFVVLQIVFAILLAVLVGALFVWAFRVYRGQRVEETDETRDSVFSMELLQEQLGRLLNRNKHGAEQAGDPFARIQGDDPRAQIRRTYQHLLAWAAERGVTRGAGQTPREFERTLATGLHVSPELVATITAGYLNARYDDEPLTQQEADTVAGAWRAIAAQGTAVSG